MQLGHRVVRAAMQAIASGADSARVAAAASQEWEAAEAEALSGASVPAETDEFGRDKNVLRRRAAVARAEARKAGRGEGGGWARAAVGQWGGKAASKEHLETFARRREEIVKTVPAVFADVDDRFSSLGVRRSLHLESRQAKRFGRVFPCGGRLDFYWAMLGLSGLILVGASSDSGWGLGGALWIRMCAASLEEETLGCS